MHPDAVRSADSEHTDNGRDGAVSADDIISSTEKPDVTSREADKPDDVQSCIADIGKLGVPIKSTSAETNSEQEGTVNQESSAGEIIMWNSEMTLSHKQFYNDIHIANPLLSVFYMSLFRIPWKGNSLAWDLKKPFGDLAVLGVTKQFLRL